MDTIHIVTATNNKYAKPLGVMIHSMLSNTKSANNIQLYIIESGLSQGNKRRLNRVAVSGGAQVQFLKIPQSLFGGLKKKKYLTQETYYRMAIPKLLGNDVTKALYLDSDMIVQKDIRKLWKKDLKGYYAAAVEKDNVSRRKKKQLGMPKRTRYFNAGVMLLNLKKWRERNIAEKIVTFSKKHRKSIEYCSQDPMNAVIKGKWRKLSRKWNFITTYARRNKKAKPAIIHYTGPKKPWEHGHPFRKAYKKYAKKLKW